MLSLRAYFYLKKTAMKKYLLLARMAAAVFASCSKDDDKASSVTAKEIEGTWEFQNPTAAEVVVKGSNSSLVDELKNSVLVDLDKGPIISTAITFKSDMTCTGTEKKENGTIENFKGSYTVSNGLLNVKLTGVEYDDHSRSFYGRLEKRGTSLYFIMDKQSAIDSYSSILKNPNLTADEVAMFKGLISGITAGISEMYCPLKMVKK